MCKIGVDVAYLVVEIAAVRLKRLNQLIKMQKKKKKERKIENRMCTKFIRMGRERGI